MTPVASGTGGVAAGGALVAGVQCQQGSQTLLADMN
jgi:hypothetical protein